MEALGTDCRGEKDRIARSFDVGAHLGRGVGFEIVDRPQMEDVIDLVGNSFDVAGRNPKARFRQVALEGNGPLLVGVPELQ